MGNPTQSSKDTSKDAKALWDKLQNVLRNEEAWYIIDRALAEYRKRVCDSCGTYAI